MPIVTSGASAAAGGDLRHGPGEDLATLTLDDLGVICHCNLAGEVLFKYRLGDLVQHHVSLLLPQLAGLDMMQKGEPNSHLRFLSHIGCHFQAVTKDGERFASQIYLNILDHNGHNRLSLIVRPDGETARATEASEADKEITAAWTPRQERRVRENSR